MATIEYLNNRIEGKKKEITKLENKLARIEKAQATGWEVNPYYYGEDDLKWTRRDLDAARAALADYMQKLATETEKANSRNVPAILEFLEGWKARVKAWYVEKFPEYLEARAARYAENIAYCEWVNHHHSKEYRDEYDARRAAEKAAEKAYTFKWSDFFPYNNRETLDIAKLESDLAKEAAAKYDFIVERVNAICGTITDATGLEINRLSGDLNGIIVGDRGTATVKTIGAGGYNIQCYHFRTLIHAKK